MSKLKKQEMTKIRKSLRGCHIFLPRGSRDVDIPYHEDEQLFETDHPELYHEMKRRDLTMDDIRYVFTKKMYGSLMEELHPKELLIPNIQAINLMYGYLSELNEENKPWI